MCERIPAAVGLAPVGDGEIVAIRPTHGATSRVLRGSEILFVAAQSVCRVETIEGEYGRFLVHGVGVVGCPAHILSKFLV